MAQLPQDWVLIQARSGDEGALEELYRYFAPLLVQYFRGRGRGTPKVSARRFAGSDPKNTGGYRRHGGPEGEGPGNTRLPADQDHVSGSQEISSVPWGPDSGEQPAPAGPGSTHPEPRDGSAPPEPVEGPGQDFIGNPVTGNLPH